MKKKTQLTIAATFALTLGLVACQPQPNNSNQDKELSAIATKLEAIDKKLGHIQAGQGRAKAPPPKRPTVGQLYNVTVSEDDAYRGGKSAKVTIVEASEFACPYCKLLAGVTDSLLEQYEDDDLRVVSKHFVVHPTIATKPALAVCAANKQGKFSEYEHALWDAAWDGEDRPRLNRDALSEQSLDRIANELNLDLSRFHSDMKEPCQKTVARNRREMSTLGVNGTPALYINGVYYGGARTTEALKAAVDAELATVDSALAKGVAIEGYYEQLVAKGKTRI